MYIGIQRCVAYRAHWYPDTNKPTPHNCRHGLPRLINTRLLAVSYEGGSLSSRAGDAHAGRSEWDSGSVTAATRRASVSLATSRSWRTKPYPSSIILASLCWLSFGPSFLFSIDAILVTCPSGECSTRLVIVASGDGGKGIWGLEQKVDSYGTIKLNWEKRRAIIFEPSFSHFLLLDSRIKFNIWLAGEGLCF